MTIVEIEVFYRTKDDVTESLFQKPTDQSIAAIKLDVAKIVHQLKQRSDLKHYYVVMKVEKSDGSVGYRTIVPRTLL